MAGSLKRDEGPYKGLFPFGIEDAPFFFGREPEIRLIVANLYGAPLTLLYGPTGVGKTSILHAGVMARLAQKEHDDAFPLAFASWQGAAGTAARALRTKISGAARGTPDESGRILPAVAGLVERTGKNVMIVLDQFEEYFLYHGRDDPLDEELVELLTQDDLPVGVLVSLREDALAALDRFADSVPELFDNFLRLRHLDEDAATAAIRGPLEPHKMLRGEDLRLGRGLVRAVFEDVMKASRDLGPWNPDREADAKKSRIEAPYLQLVMDRLWWAEHQAGSRTLHAGTLEDLGGSAGIVREHLETALGALPDEQRGLATDIFRYLVTPSGSKMALTRDDLADWTERKRDPEPIGAILERLAESPWLMRRIAPPDGAPEGARYEIVHDVVAREVAEWRKRMVEARDERERLMASGTTFENLVLAYRRRRDEERQGAVTAVTDTRYLNQRAAFEAHEGRIVKEWWGESGAATAMTAQRPTGLRRVLRGRPRLTLHRYQGEATVDAAVAERLGAVAALAAQASSSVAPAAERAVKDVLSSIESRLLAEFERPDTDRQAALAHADEGIVQVRSLVEQAARDAAPGAYATAAIATAGAVCATGGVAILDDALGARGEDLALGFIAGALGTTFSIMGRVERMAIRPGTPLAVLRLLGLAWPLIGGVLGLLIAALAGMLPAGEPRTAITVIVAFAAGFGERLIDLKRGGEP